MKTTHLTEEASVNAMEVKKRGQLSYIWFRFRKNKLAMFGLLLLLAMALICITAPLYLDYDTSAEFLPQFRHATEKLSSLCQGVAEVGKIFPSSETT